MKTDNTEEKDALKEEETETVAEEKVENKEVEQEEEVTEEDEMAKLQDEMAESKDKYLRLYSEYDNFRRRTSKEKLDLMQTANEDLMSALIPIIDDFERADKAYDKKESDVKSMKEGMDLIYNKFKKILEHKGLTAMEGKVGMAFDPDFHEAITQIPAPSKKLKGKVVDVIEKGYMLKEKVVRYAKVVTGN